MSESFDITVVVRGVRARDRVGRGKGEKPWVLHPVRIDIRGAAMPASPNGPESGCIPFRIGEGAFWVPLAGPDGARPLTTDAFRRILLPPSQPFWPANPFPAYEGRRSGLVNRVEDFGKGELTESGLGVATREALAVAADLRIVDGVIHRRVAAPVLALTFDFDDRGYWSALRAELTPLDMLRPHDQAFHPNSYVELADTVRYVPGIGENDFRDLARMPVLCESAGLDAVQWTIPKVSIPDGLLGILGEPAAEAVRRLAEVSREGDEDNPNRGIAFNQAILDLDDALAWPPPPIEAYEGLRRLCVQYMLFDARRRAAIQSHPPAMQWSPFPSGSHEDEQEDEAGGRVFEDDVVSVSAPAADGAETVAPGIEAGTGAVVTLQPGAVTIRPLTADGECPPASRDAYAIPFRVGQEREAIGFARACAEATGRPLDGEAVIRARVGLAGDAPVVMVEAGEAMARLRDAAPRLPVGRVTGLGILRQWLASADLDPLAGLRSLSRDIAPPAGVRDIDFQSAVWIEVQRHRMAWEDLP